MEIEHHIQRHIIHTLFFHVTASYAELRPPNVDSNQFAYHLKQLILHKFVEKLDVGKYRLTTKGLQYSDRYSASLNRARQQPKIITLLSIHDRDSNDMALWQRPHQPYLQLMSHPTGKLHMGESLTDAIEREMEYRLGFVIKDFTHKADAYITIRNDVNEVLTQVLAHCVSAEIEKRPLPENGNVTWQNPTQSQVGDLMPGLLEMERDLWSKTDFFFAEYNGVFVGHIE